MWTSFRIQPRCGSRSLAVEKEEGGEGTPASGGKNRKAFFFLHARIYLHISPVASAPTLAMLGPDSNPEFICENKTLKSHSLSLEWVQSEVKSYYEWICTE